ncbi:uncharacterized protein LOC117660839 isoform X3 [Pantherophis guttatus]|uniref:Uncharacterized protein LOC117660839 isoform X3 n=1 Tax=Pantherophis guttatus TaxID=94885 RepID=A0ABM3Z9N3_PANGU|nr:uncharacterized protein LOC117660839 isoform X3 [Pantherophis guttatus]
MPISRTEVTIDRHSFQGDGDKSKASGKMDFLSPRVQVSVHPSTLAMEGTVAKSAPPQHTAEMDQLKPQLRLLLSQLDINYDVENVRHSANEMELFSMVKHKFRSIFNKQQTMRTFPVYDAGTPGSEKLSIMNSNVTLKKTANWTSFIKIKPQQDPWQQKLLIKLKQWKKVDEQLQIQSKLLQASNLEYVMEALQEQAVAMLEPPPMTSAFMTSFQSKHYSQIWEKLYRNPELYQGQQTNDNNNNLIMAIDEKGMENLNFKEGSAFSGKRKHGSELTVSELLALDEDLEAPSKDLSTRKGGYLSVLYLRHLRIRELQRICLGILNYFRSIERTLTISTSGLASRSGHLISTAEDASWVNAAKGGTGAFGGLSSHSYMHYTPADYKVQSVQFMEFAEVENHDDFYTVEEAYIHTQDQRGAFVMYDVALQDLKETEKHLLLVASQYIEVGKGQKAGPDSSSSSYSRRAQTSVDRLAVLLDLWTCEADFLKNKWQLLDSYFEVYQHALDSEERFTLAQVITNIMYRRPRFDFHLGYFMNTYRDECTCLKLHLCLVRDIMNRQIENQRKYNYKIWRGGPKGCISEFGFPPHIVTKQLIALSNSPTALKNMYLLEFHSSLGLVSLIPKALDHILQEFQQICRPNTASEAIHLEEQILQLSLDGWMTMENPESFYGTQIQKDIFADVLVEDPLIIREIVTLALKSVSEEEQRSSKEKQTITLNVFSRLLELLTLRHRLIETAVEGAQLGRLYKEFAEEMGFNEFHLYLRPVYFECATHKEKADQFSPIFIASLLEDHDINVDRYIPSNLMLEIQDIDNQIGKFSFCTRESILQLLLKPYGLENLQIALACQVTHKNMVLVAVQQAAFCPSVQPTLTGDLKEGHLSVKGQSNSSPNGRSSTVGSEAEDVLMSHSIRRFAAGGCNSMRPTEAFVSIQLEKQGPRDLMLNTFIQKKHILGSRIQNPDEAEKVKREVIAEYCHRLTHRMSQYSLRSQIVAYYNSIKTMLDDFPRVKDKYFTIGLPQEKKDEKESKEKVKSDPRSFQPRPRCLLSSDGQSFLNLWFIPHSSETLAAFKMLPEKVGCSALRHTLQIVASFHDIIAYIFSFAQLGSAPGCLDYRCPSEHLTADWGGTEQIGIELLEIQKKIDSLPNSSDPKKVSHMLTMLKEVKFLQFEAAVRYSMREAFLSSGNVSAYQSITDNIYHALPPMSNAVFGSAFASQLQIPQLLDPHGQRALMLFPWRTFLAKGGLFPDTISNLNPINSSMQLCLCGLSTEDQKVAHGELIGIEFIMEDVLWNSEILIDQEVQKPFRKVSATSTSEAKGKALTAPPDTMTSYALQRSYLIQWKQLEMLKAEWGRLKLKVEDINTVPLYKQFSELYEAEIFHAAMRSIARHWGIEDEFEEYGTIQPCSLFPKEVSKIDVITHQFQKLLENLEIHMIHDVQKKINKEITLVLSEKAREERHLPTELWKHHSMQEMFSVTRPEIVESFIQRLMEDHQEINAEITFQRDHFKKCLTSLACDVMARERSNFETYSMFYENLLRWQHQLLYQKEQEVHVIEDNTGAVEMDLSQIARLSHEMILEITALRAKVTDLQKEEHNIKEKIRKEVQEDYEALVQNIFLVCLQIKGKVDEYRLSMNKQMSEIISEVRKEGVEKIINLKKKFGSTKDNSALEEHLAQQGKLQELRDENSELEKLLCKLKVLKFWKETMQKAQFLTTLQEVEKEAVQNKKECLQSQMKSEEEAILFNHQLRAIRKVLAESQTENKKLKQQLEKQEYLLQEAERKINQEFCKRQQLDLIKTANLDKMLENLGEREVKLLNLTEESEKSSKTRHFQEAKMKKEIQQIRSQLTQERNLKLNAFQKIHELQCQRYDSEAAISQKCSPAVARWSANLSHITKSKHYYFPGICLTEGKKLSLTFLPGGGGGEVCFWMDNYITLYYILHLYFRFFFMQSECRIANIHINQGFHSESFDSQNQVREDS